MFTFVEYIWVVWAITKRLMNQWWGNGFLNMAGPLNFIKALN